MSEKGSNSSNCPLSGKPGKIRRKLAGKQIFDLYKSYHGVSIKKEYFCIPLDQEINEYISHETGLLWYHPRPLGDGRYYAHLNEQYPGYYNPASWDKIECLKMITQQRPDWVVEVGCGDGWLLDRLIENGINAFGIEINEESSKLCRSRGLNVMSPTENFEPPEGTGVLCLLQTLEHLDDPLQVLNEYIKKFRPRFIHLTAPCYESLLGLTSDPLAWPPHHATSWSEKAMNYLGLRLGFKSILTTYSPLNYHILIMTQKLEQTGKFFGIPRFPSGKLGRLIFLILRPLKIPWMTRNHTIYSIFEVDETTK